MADVSARRVSATPRDLLTLPVVGSCALHPARTHVAYSLTVMDEEANAYRGSIHCLRLDGDAQQLTQGTARDQSPAWSARGDAIFFISDRSGKAQLWQVPAGGGEPVALAALSGNVSEFAVSPDGVHLAAVVTPTSNKEAIEGLGYRRITRLRYRSDGAGYLDDRPQVWLLELACGRTQQITGGSGFVAGLSWSADGTALAFSGDHEPDADSLWRRELWTAAAGDAWRPRKILSFETSIEAPAWSPDGSRLAFCGIRHRSGGGGGRNVRVYVCDARGEDVTCWTADEEWTCGNFVLTDVGAAGSILAPVWIARDELLVLGSSRGAARVFSIRAGAPARAVTPDTMSVSQFSAFDDGSIACCASDQRTPPELYRSRGETLERLTRETQAWSGRLPETGFTAFTAQCDGYEIDAWHLQGAAAAPRGCILYIHGGPHFAYGYAFVFHSLMLAAAGYDVVFCNPRGSQSYGEPFAQAIVRNWARPAFDDCMAALDAAMGRFPIDAERLGVAGGSYGGYLTVWTVAHSKRFAAAVALRPATSLLSLWGTSEVGRMLAEDFGGPPEAAPEVYAQDSPLTHAANITTPLLVIYGGEDYRTPAEQSEQLLAALMQRGAAVEGLYFPRADHNLSRGGPPRQRIAHDEAILEWFERFLGR
jgi:dipeptidyl aminopeptidase/acylaminoacyl peptidase